MRRFMLPFFVLTALVLGGCGDKGTPTAGASTAPSRQSSPQAKGDDKTACATAKSARTAVLNDLLLASMTISDKDSSAAEIAEAAQTLKASFTKLGDELSKAADQAATDKLKEALRAYANGAKTVVANVQAAGADKSKLESSTEVAAMDTAEKTVLQLCP
ncbi:MAG TPA: hypothetical protein VFC19_08765 [Candidatus Limnocylindrales bacterium]|nr:hypothetical protein [Candidatus Limnocylindrales bacterium]